MADLSLIETQGTAAPPALLDDDSIADALIKALDRAHGVFTSDQVDLLLRDGLCDVPRIADRREREAFVTRFLNDHRRVVSLDTEDDDESYFSTSEFAAREIIDLPVVRKGLAYLKVIVIQNAD